MHAIKKIMMRRSIIFEIGGKAENAKGRKRMGNFILDLLRK
jgi:hypothetical protein